MDQKDKPQSPEQQNASQQNTSGNLKNPFENNQSVETDIDQSKEELDKEQQFKEAMTERD